MEGTKVDIIDMLINFLKEHEASLGKYVGNIKVISKNLSRAMGSSIAQERLDHIEEFVLKKREAYVAAMESGEHVSPRYVVEILETILTSIDPTWEVKEK